MDIHWSHLINGIVHNKKVGDYLYKKYLHFQERKLTDETFFVVASMARLLLGLSQLAVRSKNYHNSVNKFIGNMDFNYIKSKIMDATFLNLPDLEEDFRNVTGVIKH